MTLNLNILDWEFDKKHRVYSARINFNGRTEKYEIRCTNGKIRYYDWASPELRLMICDNEDRIAQNGEVEILVSSENRYARPDIVQRELIKFMHHQ